ncbi:MAG: insulinase family protein [Anaeromyxobacteraceae bacterium]
MTPLSLLAAALLAGAGPAAAPPARSALPSGLELAVVPVAGARAASLRLVVRTGSEDDPPRRQGLAHVLEHVLLSRVGKDGLDPVQAARAAGGRLNAFTSRHLTTFALDAPAATFPALAERLLRAVATPDLERAELDRELAVIAREDEYGGSERGVLDLLEETLFEGQARVDVIGDHESREAVDRAALARQHADRYRPARISVAFTGAVDPERARALVAQAFPPGPAAGPGPRDATVEAARLPATRKLRALLLATAVAHRLDPADRDACPALAALVERRLYAELAVRRAIAREASASCVSLRGTPLLVALVNVPSIEAEDLPTRIGRVLEDVAAFPADAAERRDVARRLAREADRAAADPAALAEALAGFAAWPGELLARPLPGAAPRVLEPGALRDVARRTFLPERRATLVLSPFEG